MLENLDVLASAKRVAEELSQSLQATWKQVLDMDSSSCGVPSSVLFLSSSFLFLIFTLLSFFSGYSEHFSLLIVGTLGLHTILGLTRNPICTTLHYQILFSYILSLFVLFYSPELPNGEAKILLPILVPLYYHFMTSSVQTTVLFSVPYLFFLQCSFLYTSFPNTSILAAFLVIPTSIWTNARDLQKKLDCHNKLQFNGKKSEQEQSQENVIDVQKPPQMPRLNERRDSEISLPDTENEEQEKVILGISHDCRNLLNSLKATLTLLKDETSGEETAATTQDDNLQSAIAITEHLTLLLTNLLDYLRKKNDDTNFSQETRLTTTLEKIWLMMSPNLKKKNLGGSITIKNGTPLTLQLDEHKFMGILLNLIGNSTKFTDTGHIKVNVHWRENPQPVVKPPVDTQQNHVSKIRDRLKKADIAMKRVDSKGEKDDSEQANPVLSKTTFFDLRDIDSISFSKKCFTAVNEAKSQANQPGQPDQGVLVVSVRDTGCGIEEDSLKKIFKKYGQVGEDHEKSKMGLGLGLWYTKYLLKKLQGRIDFRSSKNVGTWAKVEIPCKVAPKKRDIHQMIRPEVRMQARGKALNETSYVFIRENDRLGSLLVKEYVKKHIDKQAKVVEIKSLSEIMRSEKYRNEHCVLVLGESAATRPEIQTLNMLLRLNQGQKLPIVLLRDCDERFKAGENAWDNVEVDTIVKKPLRTVQLSQVVTNIRSAIENKVVAENEGRQNEEVAHVLVVDDDETIRTFSQKCLEKNGISTLVAKDGVEALEIYRKEYEKIKIILMDSEMPKLNGLDATKEIRKISNDRQLKIIGLTGDDSDEFRAKARENGMDEVFVKPLPVDQLLRAVHTAI